MLPTVTNEFAREVENRGIRGVQLFPALVEILILMFADDLALTVYIRHSYWIITAIKVTFQFL